MAHPPSRAIYPRGRLGRFFCFRLEFYRLQFIKYNINKIRTNYYTYNQILITVFRKLIEDSYVKFVYDKYIFQLAEKAYL
jgi:hypothetical protein